MMGDNSPWKELSIDIKQYLLILVRQSQFKKVHFLVLCEKQIKDNLWVIPRKFPGNNTQKLFNFRELLPKISSIKYYFREYLYTQKRKYFHEILGCDSRA